MFKTLKRALATATTAALLATNAGVALAQTFKDVPTDAWYYDYVEQLVDDGVVDAGNTFRPNDSLNRAELVKMAITAVDGLADYEAPATPTFDDVPANAWYYDYVEAAVQLGIAAGYTDAKGNLTGKFGPGDTVNRAAATKILVNAFSVETTLSPASKFSDVKSGAWFYDYVVTAYNQSILDGYANGMFGPADPVTRAQVAKLVVNAQNPMLREAGEGEGEGVPPAPASGALEVSLNDSTPASSTLPISASSVKLASFDFTAADDDVTLSNLVVTRGGVGKAGDWNALYLYEGAKRLTTGRSINADTNTATFAVNIAVDAGTTKTLTLVGDVTAAAGASNQHYFYIASAADVTSGALSVAGDFPVAGNTFTMGGAATVVNAVTVSTGSAISQPQIGQMDAEISSFRLAAGATNDIAIHQVSLTQNGSLASGKMKNLKLLRGTDEVATAAGFDGDRVTFVLGTPYVIPKGQTKSFYVHSDIDGGRTTDTVQLYLDEDTDLVAIDQQYGYGALVTNICVAATPNALKPVAAPCVGVPATFLKGGTVTVSDNGPAGHQVAQNTTNVHLLDYSVTAGRDLTVKDMDLRIEVRSAGAGTAPNVAAIGNATIGVLGAGNNTNTACVTTASIAPAGSIVADDMIQMPTATGTVYAIVVGLAAPGTCGAGETEITTNVPVASAVALVAGAGALGVQELNPYALVKNVKVVDLDSGSTLQGPMTKASDGVLTVVGGDDLYVKKMSEDYELLGGEARHLGIMVDIDQTLASGYKLTATIDYAIAGYIKDMAANENVVLADLVGGTLTGKTMSVAANSLAVTRANTPSSQTYVKGEDKVPSLGVTLTAGDAGDITIKKLNLRVYGVDDTVGGAAGSGWLGAVAGTGAWTYMQGNVPGKDLVSSVTLYDGNDVVDGPRTLTLVNVGGTADFDMVNAAGDYYKVLFDNLNVKVNKGSTKSLVAKVKLTTGAAANRWIALDMLPNADITAEDADANTITASGAALNGLAAHAPVLTIVPAGTLSATAESTNLDSKVIVAGSTMQLVGKYKFNALREGFNINKLTIVDMGSTAGEFVAVSPAATSTAVGQVVLKYADVNGVTQTKTGSLSAGVATISDLGFFVPTGSSTSYVEIYANVNSKEAAGGELVSGQNFRLGIRGGALAAGVPNTVSTFEAVGVASSTTLNDTEVGTDEVVFNNAPSLNTFIVRKTVPTFAKVAYSDLSSGKLFGLNVTADAAGTVYLARVSFTVKNNGAAGVLGPFTFKRAGSTISGVFGAANANIWNSTAASDLAGAGVVAAGATNNVIVSFNQEETLAAPPSQTVSYTLEATAAGFAINETVTTTLNAGDDLVPVAGITNPNTCAVSNFVANANTGRISDVGDADCALFVGATDDLGKLTGVARNIIWSDGSNDNHIYPTVAVGALTDGSGSYDWTNGYLLKASKVDPNTARQ